MFIGRMRELSSLNRLYESVLAKIGKAFFSESHFNATDRVGKKERLQSKDVIIPF